MPITLPTVEKKNLDQQNIQFSVGSVKLPLVLFLSLLTVPNLDYSCHLVVVIYVFQIVELNFLATKMELESYTHIHIKKGNVFALIVGS